MTDLIRKSDARAECQHLASAYENKGETEKQAVAEACDRAIAALEPAPVTEDQKRRFLQEAPARRAERIERWSNDERIKAMLREPVAAPNPAAIREAALREAAQKAYDKLYKKQKYEEAQAVRDAIHALISKETKK